MKFNIYSLFFIALLLGGCGVSTKIAIPKTEFPLEYNNHDTKNKDVKIKEEWWKDFQDEKLSLLIDEALKNNLDLQIAMVNISLSRASLSSSSSDRYPTLELQGSTNKIKNNSSTNNTYSLSSIFSYELDLWGKYKEAENVAKSSLIASYAAKDTVKLSLIANIIDNYFTLISLNEQLSIINQIILMKEEELKNYKVQYKLGSISKVNIFQEETSLISLNIDKNSLLQTLALQKSTLAILVGKDPKHIESFCKEIFKDKLPKDIEIPINLPSDLLNNRPDIKQAEENLKASHYNISVAKAMYFPKISLNALIGFESMDVSNLFNSNSIKNSLGTTIGLPLLNRGKISANVDSATANKELAEINYKKTVQQAFQEVYDILNNRKNILQKIKNQKQYSHNMKEIVRVMKNQYTQGNIDYLMLSNVERNYLLSQLSLIQLNQSLLSSTISFYKALGGGWNKKFLKSIECCK